MLEILKDSGMVLLLIDTQHCDYLHNHKFYVLREHVEDPLQYQYIGS
jgi:hypothetical protein